jgi:hypothetical protein
MPNTSPAQPSTDRNLLFGILAVQMDFVSRDALIAGMHAWVLAKHRPLGELLQEQGALSPEHRQLLEQMTAAHLRAHGGDAQQSLAAVRQGSMVGAALGSVADRDLQASLAVVDGTLRTTDDYGRPAEGMRYRVLRPHARGGLGVVSVARDTELGREVALKEIRTGHAADAVSRGRFVREAEITGGLEHPGVVPVYGLGRYDDGRPYYAMRFIRGESLQEAIKKLHTHQEGYLLRGLLTPIFELVTTALGVALRRGWRFGLRDADGLENLPGSTARLTDALAALVVDLEVHHRDRLDPYGEKNGPISKLLCRLYLRPPDSSWLRPTDCCSVEPAPRREQRRRFGAQTSALRRHPATCPGIGERR